MSDTGMAPLIKCMLFSRWSVIRSMLVLGALLIKKKKKLLVLGALHRYQVSTSPSPSCWYSLSLTALWVSYYSFLHIVTFMVQYLNVKWLGLKMEFMWVQVWEDPIGKNNVVHAPISHFLAIGGFVDLSKTHNI